jgi:hypothetical protein
MSGKMEVQLEKMQCLEKWFVRFKGFLMAHQHKMAMLLFPNLLVVLEADDL